MQNDQGGFTNQPEAGSEGFCNELDEHVTNFLNRFGSNQHIDVIRAMIVAALADGRIDAFDLLNVGQLVLNRLWHVERTGNPSPARDSFQLKPSSE